jgi:hypothetical protein
MITLILLFALRVVNPSEMACVGSIQDRALPLDVYIAGVEMEGTATFAVEGQILYLNGPKVSSLKPGTIQQVVRPEGKVRDPKSGDKVGLYYRDIGTIRIEDVDQDKATATVQASCQAMLKGDVIVPQVPKPEVEFNGELSNELTRLPDHGLVGSVLLGKEDGRELGAGNFCFLGLGGRDGIKPGDRLTVFRSYPPFNSKDLNVEGSSANRSYSPVANYVYRMNLISLLHKRKLPPRILGDIVVVEAGDKVSTGKIINSISEIHVGDLIVKR